LEVGRAVNVCTYVSLPARHEPTLSGIVAEKVPFLSLLSILMFLICVWQIGVILWPKRDGGNIANTSDASFIARLDRKDEEREVKVEKQITKKMAPKLTVKPAGSKATSGLSRKSCGRTSQTGGRRASPVGDCSPFRRSRPDHRQNPHS